jgi:hypothetical protein
VIDEGFQTAYRAAYQRPHKAIFRCEVWDDTEQLLESLPILAGEVKCTLNSQVTRSGSISVPRLYMPKKPTDLLAPFGNRLRIYRGIEFGGRQFWCRVFTGMIQEVGRKPRQPVVLQFADRGAEVEENDFEKAEETLGSKTIVEELVRLIREGVPDAEFGTHDLIGAQAASNVFDDSRSQACDQLADAGGAFWYALADGRFVVRRVPWAYQPEGSAVEPVVEYREFGGFYGDSQGTITDYDMSMSRKNVYNIVVGVADQPDGGAPRREAVRDTIATSPTYVGSKFGRRVLKAELPAAATSAVVRHGAESLRRRSRASAEAMTWVMVPDPSLELGDVTQLDVDERRLIRCVSEFNIPLTEGGEMTVTGRPLVLPDGTVVDERVGF